MPGLAALEAIGTGFGQGTEAIQRQQQAAAQLALQRLALQQAQTQQQSMAALLPGLVAAYGQGGQQQQQPEPPAGFTGPGFTTPGPTGAPTPLMPPTASGAGAGGGGPPAGGVPVPPSLAPIYGRESGFNYGAKNPASTASGAGQDINSTWREAMQGLGYGDAYPTASSAPPAVQNAANIWLQAKRGNKPWASSAPPGTGLTGAGQAAVRGAPPEFIAQGRQAATQVAQTFDPMEYGKIEMGRAVAAIDAQDIPPEAKVMAMVQMAQLLQPQDRMMLSMYAMQNRDLIAQARLGLEEQRVEQGQERVEQAGERGQIFQQPDGSFVDVTPSGVKPIQGLQPGASKPSSTGGQWSKDSMDALVDRALATGDQSVLSQLPRTGAVRKQFEETLAARMKDLPGGIEGGVAGMVMNNMRMAEAKAAASQAGRITMNTQLYSAEAEGAAKLVVDASKLVPRTNLPTINAIEEAGLKQTGDPGVIKLGIALNALLNAYGKMSNPTGTGIHDADKERLNAQLSMALSQGQIEGGVQQVVKEGLNLSQAAQQAQTEVLKTILPAGAGGNAQPQPGATPGVIRLDENGNEIK